MSRNIGKFLILAIGFVLMVYSASRTLAFLQMTLPDGQKEMAFLALAAFDGGLIAWTIFFMRGAEGGPQRAISLLMIVISLAGVVIGFGADTLIGASSGGLIAKVNPALAFSALLATIGIIAINSRRRDPCPITGQPARHGRGRSQRQDRGISPQANLAKCRLACFGDCASHGRRMEPEHARALCQ